MVVDDGGVGVVGCLDKPRGLPSPNNGRGGGGGQTEGKGGGAAVAGEGDAMADDEGRVRGASQWVCRGVVCLGRLPWMWLFEAMGMPAWSWEAGKLAVVVMDYCSVGLFGVEQRQAQHSGRDSGRNPGREYCLQLQLTRRQRRVCRD